MNEMQIKVLELVKENKTINDITSELNISRKRLISILNSLKNNGFETNKSYWIDGSIKIVAKKSRHESDLKINGVKKESKYLLISDTHLGSKKDRVDLIDKAYEYAIKNNINIILNLGDFVDGYNFNTDKSRNKDARSQFLYAMKKYPYDKNITNMVLLGNHDISTLNNYGFSLIPAIENERLDIVPIGYEKKALCIDQDSIMLFHRITCDYEKKSKSKINLMGHHHKYTTKFENNRLYVSLPSISDIRISDTILEKGILEMNLKLKEHTIEEILLRHVILEPKITVCSESTYTYQK